MSVKYELGATLAKSHLRRMTDNGEKVSQFFHRIALSIPAVKDMVAFKKETIAVGDLFAVDIRNRFQLPCLPVTAPHRVFPSDPSAESVRLRHLFWQQCHHCSPKHHGFDLPVTSHLEPFL